MMDKIISVSEEQSSGQFEPGPVSAVFQSHSSASCKRFRSHLIKTLPVHPPHKGMHKFSIFGFNYDQINHSKFPQFLTHVEKCRNAYSDSAPGYLNSNFKSTSYFSTYRM